jgi:hypothetical protein
MSVPELVREPSSQRWMLQPVSSPDRGYNVIRQKVELVVYDTKGGKRLVDFKKAISKLRYEFVKETDPNMYTEICAFSSTLDVPLRVKAQVEDYCMGVARTMYLRGQLNHESDLTY